MSLRSCSVTRVHILDLPVASPGHCAICGSVGGDGRKFIDWSFALDWFGAVYLCTICMTEVVEKTNLYVAIGRFKALEESVAYYTGTIDTLSEENSRLRDALRVFGSMSDLLQRDSSPSLSALQVAADNDKSNTVSESGSQGSDESGSVEESGSVRSTPATSESESDEFLKSLEY